MPQYTCSNDASFVEDFTILQPTWWDYGVVPQRMSDEGKSQEIVQTFTALLKKVASVTEHAATDDIIKLHRMLVRYQFLMDTFAHTEIPYPKHGNLYIKSLIYSILVGYDVRTELVVEDVRRQNLNTIADIANAMRLDATYDLASVPPTILAEYRFILKHGIRSVNDVATPLTRGNIPERVASYAATFTTLERLYNANPIAYDEIEAVVETIRTGVALIRNLKTLLTQTVNASDEWWVLPVLSGIFGYAGYDLKALTLTPTIAVSHPVSHYIFNDAALRLTIHPKYYRPFNSIRFAPQHEVEFARWVELQTRTTPRKTPERIVCTTYDPNASQHMLPPDTSALIALPFCDRMEEPIEKELQQYIDNDVTWRLYRHLPGGRDCLTAIIRRLMHAQYARYAHGVSRDIDIKFVANMPLADFSRQFTIRDNRVMKLNAVTESIAQQYLSREAWMPNTPKLRENVKLPRDIFVETFGVYTRTTQRFPSVTPEPNPNPNPVDDTDTTHRLASMMTDMQRSAAYIRNGEMSYVWKLFHAIHAAIQATTSDHSDIRNFVVNKLRITKVTHSVWIPTLITLLVNINPPTQDTTSMLTKCPYYEQYGVIGALIAIYSDEKGAPGEWMASSEYTNVEVELLTLIKSDILGASLPSPFNSECDRWWNAVKVYAWNAKWMQVRFSGLLETIKNNRQLIVGPNASNAYICPADLPSDIVRRITGVIAYTLLKSGSQLSEYAALVAAYEQALGTVPSNDDLSRYALDGVSLEDSKGVFTTTIIQNLIAVDSEWENVPVHISTPTAQTPRFVLELAMCHVLLRDHLLEEPTPATDSTTFTPDDLTSLKTLVDASMGVKGGKTQRALARISVAIHNGNQGYVMHHLTSYLSYVAQNSRPDGTPFAASVGGDDTALGDMFRMFKRLRGNFQVNEQLTSRQHYMQDLQGSVMAHRSQLITPPKPTNVTRSLLAAVAELIHDGHIADSNAIYTVYSLLRNVTVESAWLRSLYIPITAMLQEVIRDPAHTLTTNLPRYKSSTGELPATIEGLLSGDALAKYANNRLPKMHVKLAAISVSRMNDFGVMPHAIDTSPPQEEERDALPTEEQEEAPVPEDAYFGEEQEEGRDYEDEHEPSSDRADNHDKIQDLVATHKPMKLMEWGMLDLLRCMLHNNDMLAWSRIDVSIASLSLGAVEPDLDVFYGIAHDILLPCVVESIRNFNAAVAHACAGGGRAMEYIATNREQYQRIIMGMSETRLETYMFHIHVDGTSVIWPYISSHLRAAFNLTSVDMLCFMYDAQPRMEMYNDKLSEGMVLVCNLHTPAAALAKIHALLKSCDSVVANPNPNPDTLKTLLSVRARSIGPFVAVISNPNGPAFTDAADISHDTMTTRGSRDFTRIARYLNAHVAHEKADSDSDEESDLDADQSFNLDYDTFHELNEDSDQSDDDSDAATIATLYDILYARMSNERVEYHRSHSLLYDEKLNEHFGIAANALLRLNHIECIIDGHPKDDDLVASDTLARKLSRMFKYDIIGLYYQSFPCFTENTFLPGVLLAFGSNPNPTDVIADLAKLKHKPQDADPAFFKWHKLPREMEAPNVRRGVGGLVIDYDKKIDYENDPVGRKLNGRRTEHLDIARLPTDPAGIFNVLLNITALMTIAYTAKLTHARPSESGNSKILQSLAKVVETLTSTPPDKYAPYSKMLLNVICLLHGSYLIPPTWMSYNFARCQYICTGVSSGYDYIAHDPQHTHMQNLYSAHINYNATHDWFIDRLHRSCRLHLGGSIAAGVMQRRYDKTPKGGFGLAAIESIKMLRYAYRARNPSALDTDVGDAATNLFAFMQYVMKECANFGPKLAQCAYVTYYELAWHMVRAQFPFKLVRYDDTVVTLRTLLHAMYITDAYDELDGSPDDGVRRRRKDLSMAKRALTKAVVYPHGLIIDSLAFYNRYFDSTDICAYDSVTSLTASHNNLQVTGALSNGSITSRFHNPDLITKRLSDISNSIAALRTTFRDFITAEKRDFNAAKNSESDRKSKPNVLLDPTLKYYAFEDERSPAIFCFNVVQHLIKERRLEDDGMLTQMERILAKANRLQGHPLFMYGSELAEMLVTNIMTHLVENLDETNKTCIHVKQLYAAMYNPPKSVVGGVERAAKRPRLAAPVAVRQPPQPQPPQPPLHPEQLWTRRVLGEMPTNDVVTPETTAWLGQLRATTVETSRARVASLTIWPGTEWYNNEAIHLSTDVFLGRFRLGSSLKHDTYDISSLIEHGIISSGMGLVDAMPLIPAEVRVVTYPYNINASHWMLIALDRVRETIAILDPLRGIGDHTAINATLTSVSNAMFHAKLDPSRWRRIKQTDLFPNGAIQRNGYDCGPYVALFAGLIALYMNQNFVPRTDDIPYAAILEPVRGFNMARLRVATVEYIASKSRNNQTPTTSYPRLDSNPIDCEVCVTPPPAPPGWYDSQ